MPSASIGLELPETSLMAPLLLAIPLSWGALSSGRKQGPDTSRLEGWQHESGPCPRRIFRPEPATVGLVNCRQSEWRIAKWRIAALPYSPFAKAIALICRP